MPDSDLPLTHREISRPIDVSASAAKVARGSRFALCVSSLHAFYLLLGVLVVVGVLWAVGALAGDGAAVVLVLVGVAAAWVWAGVFAVRTVLRRLRRRKIRA